MTAYYNEFEPYVAQWLRNLIAVGLIAPGFVDERSIEDVRPDDLREFTQCHFFAGIGVWSYALRRAGWPDDRPVWTGSCPCQPFSAAGSGAGFADERHLWPAFFHLIEQCRPPAVFGEQVASKDADPWIDLVQTDLEALGYRFGAVPFPAASVGAPHIRDRLYWMGHTSSTRLERHPRHDGAARRKGAARPAAAPGLSSGLANAEQRSGGRKAATASYIGSQADRSSDQRSRHSSASTPGSSPTHGFWRDADWLLCRDGKWRPVEPGTFPLVARPASDLGRMQPELSRLYASNRKGRLKAYGNAINAEAAQAFIEAAMSCMP